MNSLKLFNSSEFGNMRTCCDPNTGEIWFNLNDICKALEINNSRMVKNRLDDEYVRSLNINELENTVSLTDGNNRGNPNMSFVNESGLYEVILRSDSPKAKPFRKRTTVFP